MRTLCLTTFGFLVGLVIYNYDLKLQSKILEKEAAGLAVQIQDETDFIALMRAEISHLSEPKRIDELARSKLGFQPVTPAQVVPLNAVLQGAAPSWQPQIASRTRREDGIAALIDRTAGIGKGSGSR